jgi:membrane-bound serine protease (ClpP class)
MKSYNILTITMLLLAICFATLASAADVYVVEIRKDIGKGLREYIRSGIKTAEKNYADAIIFDISTFGGAVAAMEDIVDDIYNTDIPTIAYVNSKAISAGAMIAISCDQIVMRSGGTLGDAAPVYMGGQEAPEKVVSVIRAKIRAIAQRQGRNADIAEAMVDKNRVLVKIGDEIVALVADDYNKKMEAGELMPEDVIVPEGELLTLTTDEALEYGFADARAENIDELLEMYEIVKIKDEYKALTSDAIIKMKSEGVEIEEIMSLAGAKIKRIKMTLAERLAIFITSPMISAMLLTFGGLGLLIELRTPGFGFPGMIGIISLGLFFGGHTIANVNASYAALAFVIGLGLLMLEILVIPGFGIAGISGIGLMLGGILFIFGESYEPEEAILWLSISFIATVGLGIVAFYTLPKTRTWQQFVLSTAENSELGYQAPSRELENYAGKTGRALTPLRPAGTAIIDGSRVDVVTEGGFISRDMPVKVVRVEGMKVIVQEIEE